MNIKTSIISSADLKSNLFSSSLYLKGGDESKYKADIK